MKTAKKTRKKKILIISSILFAVIACCFIAYAVFGQNGKFSLPGQESSQTEDTDKKSEGDIENTTNTPDKTTPPNTDLPAQPEVEESTGKRIVSVISSTNIDGNAVYIRGGVNTPEATGSCYATLSGPNNARIQKNTTLLPSANSSDCKTIEIPLSELSPGEWSVILNFSSDSAKGASNAETIIVN